VLSDGRLTDICGWNKKCLIANRKIVKIAFVLSELNKMRMQMSNMMRMEMMRPTDLSGRCYE